jgi:3-methyladenine DNA glycosylase AlkD
MTGTLPDAVRFRLAAAGDLERATSQQAYMRSALPFHGVAVPHVRAVVRAELAAHPCADRAAWSAVALDLWDGATHREEWYAALAVLRRPRDRAWWDPDLLPLLRHLVETGAWWDVVDEVAAHLVGAVLAGHRDAVSPVLLAWASDDHLWIRRAALLAQLRHAADTDTRLLADVLDLNLAGSPHGDDVFVRKAVGWALRQHARTDGRWVLEYVRSRHAGLSAMSRREALKHLPEGRTPANQTPTSRTSMGQTGTSSTAPTA